MQRTIELDKPGLLHLYILKSNNNYINVERPEKSFTQGGDRTHDPLLASQVLYQLSYPGVQFCLRFVPIITVNSPCYTHPHQVEIRPRIS